MVFVPTITKPNPGGISLKIWLNMIKTFLRQPVVSTHFNADCKNAHIEPGPINSSVYIFQADSLVVIMDRVGLGGNNSVVESTEALHVLNCKCIIVTQLRGNK